MVVPATLLMSTSINPSDVTLSNGRRQRYPTRRRSRAGSRKPGQSPSLYGAGRPDPRLYRHADGERRWDVHHFVRPRCLHPRGTAIVGTYDWVVSYSGDANNNPVVGPLGNESGQVNPANPSLATSPSPGRVTLSSESPPILTDSATLTGGFEETGTITFDSRTWWHGARR